MYPMNIESSDSCSREVGPSSFPQVSQALSGRSDIGALMGLGSIAWAQDKDDKTKVMQIRKHPRRQTTR